MQDPLVSALTDAVELALSRGIEVKPQGDGWFIRLADAQSGESNTNKAETSLGWKNW